MPPIAFRNREEGSPRLPAKRRAATFKDGQSPLPKQQRAFGTDITNKAHHARPVFKPTDRDANSPVRPPELLRNKKEQSTPIKFVETRNDEPDESLGSSPLVKPNAYDSPLATLVETRLLELKTQKPHTEPMGIDSQEFEQWNPVCFMKSDMIIINPRKIPLEHAQVYRHSDKTCVAGVW